MLVYQKTKHRKRRLLSMMMERTVYQLISVVSMKKPRLAFLVFQVCWSIVFHRISAHISKWLADSPYSMCWAKESAVDPIYSIVNVIYGEQSVSLIWKIKGSKVL